jgi:putative membrane protein
MVSVLTDWLISAIAILLISKYLPGFDVTSFTTALIVALVLGILNALIKPVILILTLPINILTLGLFTFVINAFLLILASYFVQGFHIVGFMPALIAAFFLWIINVVLHIVVFPVRK